MYAIRYLAILALIACSGCASIFCGANKTISVDSTPEGADFKVTGPSGKVFVQGVTPKTVTLKRGRAWFKAGDYTATFTKTGYKEHTVPVRQGLETGWYLAGNIILFGGLIGIVVVDPLTGAMWNIEDVNVSLEPEAVVHTPQGDKKVEGYRATIDPKTGKVVTRPAYENR